MNTVQEIERAIDALTPQQMEDLYVWLDQRHPSLSMRSLKPIMSPGASTTAPITLWQTGRPETNFPEISTQVADKK